MRRIRDCFRLYYENNMNQSQISRLLKISRSTVQDYLSRLSIASLSYDQFKSLNDSDLETLLFKKKTDLESKANTTVFHGIIMVKKSRRALKKV